MVQTLELSSKPNYYSVSRLKLYENCSYAYYHRYVLKTPSPYLSESTLIGSFIHNALEYLYSTDDDTTYSLEEAFSKTSPHTMVEQKIAYSLEEAYQIYDMLSSYTKDVAILYIRASATYYGPDAIRKADGGLASSPSMTSDWKKAEKLLDLPRRRSIIDTYITDRNSNMNGISISYVFGEAYNICLNYRTPPQITEIIAVEFPLSHWSEEQSVIINPVKMPSAFGAEEDIYLNGYIDLVAKVNFNGKEVLALIDHKSSKADHEELGVEYNRQLLAYVYAYEKSTGQTIDAVGINNLRSNTLSLAPVNKQFMYDSLTSLFSNHQLIKEERFVKHVPEDQYSPCMKMYNKPCPFLPYCHTDFYNRMMANQMY